MFTRCVYKMCLQDVFARYVCKMCLQDGFTRCVYKMCLQWVSWKFASSCFTVCWLSWVMCLFYVSEFTVSLEWNMGGETSAAGTYGINWIKRETTKLDIFFFTKIWIRNRPTATVKVHYNKLEGNDS